MKNNYLIPIALIVIFVLAIVIFERPVRTVKKIEKAKAVKIDAEKLGKKVGDFRRNFLKGYYDTTKVKDSLK